jgi:mRNA interferase RelE/StbE
MWSVRFSEKSIKELNKFPKDIQNTLRKAISERLEKDPLRFKRLIGEWKGCYRLQVANYRIIYEVKEEESLVIIIKIDVRSKVYKFSR